MTPATWDVVLAFINQTAGHHGLTNAQIAAALDMPLTDVTQLTAMMFKAEQIGRRRRGSSSPVAYTYTPKGMT